MSAERRGKGTTIYKLRYRLHGRQMVNYLGTDAASAQRVEAMLGNWQRRRRAELAFRALARETAKLAKQSKQHLAPLMVDAGLHFHGRAIRRKRTIRRPLASEM